VVPDVDHGIACTCPWNFVGYPMVGIPIPIGEVQHVWDPMVGIPTPPERGCGWLSYAGLSCSYVGHREGSHPMCEGALNYTCKGYAQSIN
jgi:hypothetical protein